MTDDNTTTAQDEAATNRVPAGKCPNHGKVSGDEVHFRFPTVAECAECGADLETAGLVDRQLVTDGGARSDGEIEQYRAECDRCGATSPWFDRRDTAKETADVMNGAPDPVHGNVEPCCGGGASVKTRVVNNAA